MAFDLGTYRRTTLDDRYPLLHSATVATSHPDIDTETEPELLTINAAMTTTADANLHGFRWRGICENVRGFGRKIAAKGFCDYEVVGCVNRFLSGNLLFGVDNRDAR